MGYKYTEFMILTPNQLKNLTVLDLGCSGLDALTHEQWRVLCQTIAQCDNLISLNLSSNKLSVLRPAQWQAIGQAFAQCENLTSLDLSGNYFYRLPNQCWQYLYEALAQGQSITSLDLSYNVHTNQGYWQYLYQAISQGQSSSSPDLSYNASTNLGYMKQDYFEAFCQLFTQCPKLNSLNLGSNNLDILTSAQWQYLGQVLVQCQNLTSLDLWAHNFSRCANGFGQMLAECPNISSLRLSQNSFSEFTLTQWHDFGQALAQSQNLTELNLGCNQLPSFNRTQWQALGHVLAQCRNLTSLDFSHYTPELGRLTLEQCQEFGQVLIQCKNLTSLSLSKSELYKFKGNHWQVLGQVFAQCLNLKELNLCANRLDLLYFEISGSDRTWSDFCKALAQCQNLTSLDLSNSDLNFYHPTWQVLGQALTQCTKLTSVNLSWNRLNTVHGQNWDLFAQAFVHCQNLRKLDFSNNQLHTLNTEDWVRFLNAVSKIKCLREVIIPGLSVERERALITILHKNQNLFSVSSMMMEGAQFMFRNMFTRSEKIELGTSLIIEDNAYVFIKPKSDGKNQSIYDGVYAVKDVYDTKIQEDKFSLSTYQRGELYFLKMFPKQQVKRVEGFTEALAGNMIKALIQAEVIKPFFSDCFIPASVVQLPNNFGSALFAPFVIGAQSLFQLSDENQREKHAFFETIRRELLGVGYEQYLGHINHDEQPYHGLSYIVMMMVLLGNYSVHSGNILVSYQTRQTNFTVIDYGASFRNFIGTIEQHDIWESLEEQNKKRIDGWAFKKYLDFYKTIPGFFYAVVNHAEKLNQQINSSEQQLIKLKKLLKKVVKETLSRYKESIVSMYGHESWRVNKENLFRYIYGTQYDNLLKRIDNSARSGNKLCSDIADEYIANDITKVLLARLETLSTQLDNIPAIRDLEPYESLAPSSQRSSFLSRMSYNSFSSANRTRTGTFMMSKLPEHADVIEENVNAVPPPL